MDDRIDRNKLRERQQTSLTDHYLGLHVTVVSVALATAGVSAASLIARPENMGTGLVELWLLWFGSFLATAVAYAGTMVGAFALPPSVPKIVDLLLPLIMGIVEFLLFTILIRQITALTQLDTIINAWLILMALFGAVAGLSVLQARHHFIVGLLAGTYLGDARQIIEGYVRHLVSDVLGTGLLTIVAALAFSLRIAGFTWEWLAYLSIILTIVIMLGGLVSHSYMAGLWRRSLRYVPPRGRRAPQRAVPLHSCRNPPDGLPARRNRSRKPPQPAAVRQRQGNWPGRTDKNANRA